MSTAESGWSPAAQPVAAPPGTAAASGAPAPTPAQAAARQGGDLAALLLCLCGALSPLMTAESPGTVVVRALLVAAAILTVIHDVVLQRPWRPRLPLLAALLCWIAGTLVASFGGVHSAGLDLTLIRWSGFALCACAAHRLGGDPHRRRLLFAALICGAVLLTAYGFEESWLERPYRIATFDTAAALQSAAAADMRSLSLQERYFNPRIAGGFLSANLMGAAFGLGALAAAGGVLWLWRARFPKSAIVLATAGVLMLCGLWLTGSKGAQLGLLCGAAVMLTAGWAARAVPDARFRRRAPALLLALLLGGTLLLPVLAAFVPETHAPDFTADGEPIGALKSAWVRVDYWQTGWRLWREHPVGIGPDQTQQLFSQARSPWALETPVDLHHEAFEMLVECGPLAALGMIAALGWILATGLARLRETAVAPVTAAVPTAAPIPPPVLFLPLPLMAAFALVGGWLLCATLGFFDMNGQVDLTLIVHEFGSRWTLPRLEYFAAIFATVILAAVGLARLNRPLPAAAPEPVGRAVLLGLLAALLVHSGVDFVLQNQALLVWAGLIAGLLTAGPAAVAVAPAPVADPAAPAPSPRERLRRRLPLAALAFCALILAWLGVIQPLRLALARVQADALLRDFDNLLVAQAVSNLNAPSMQAFRQQVQDTGPQLVAACRAVVEMAPEDREAVLQYHLAVVKYKGMAAAAQLPPVTIQGLGNVPRRPDEELRHLADAYVGANPADPFRWFYAGRTYWSTVGTDSAASLKTAADAFATAARLEPRRPLLHLVVGDCRLAMGDRPGAAQAYAAAWDAQLNTSTPEVQFYCLYYDPGPEIEPPPETGMDQTLVDRPTMLLHDLDQVDSAARAALLRRYWVALRAVQLNTPVPSAPADPDHPTATEKEKIGRWLSYALREKQTLDQLLELRPGSVDTQLLLLLRAATHRDDNTPPPTDAEVARAFDRLKSAARQSTVDQPLPGVIERIEAAVRFPPRLRYGALPTVPAVPPPAEPGPGPAKGPAPADGPAPAAP